MTYHRFEDLPVWQEAMRLAHGVFGLTENPKFKINYSLRDQIERSSMSVSDNIAEGFERGTTNELLAYIYISRGSAGETRSKLRFMEQRPALAAFRPELARLKSLAEFCSKQLRAWADSLQDSPIKGQRLLNQNARERTEQQKRAAAMQRKLLAMLPPDHPLRRAKRNGRRRVTFERRGSAGRFQISNLRFQMAEGKLAQFQ
ncbi:MAG: four helix bundle protein [Verrucomicrobiota bacterium]